MKFTARLRSTTPNAAIIDPTKFVCVGCDRQTVTAWARQALANADDESRYVEITELRDEVVSVLTRRQVVVLTLNADGVEEEKITYETVETVVRDAGSPGGSRGTAAAAAGQPESGNGSAVGIERRGR